MREDVDVIRCEEIHNILPLQNLTYILNNRDAVQLYVTEITEEMKEAVDAAGKGDWGTVYDILNAHKGKLFNNASFFLLFYTTFVLNV